MRREPRLCAPSEKCPSGPSALVRAVRAERKALFEADTTNQISQFMLGMFDINNPSEARGRSVTAKEILDRTAAHIQTEITDRPVLKARLLEAMGKVYRSLIRIDIRGRRGYRGRFAQTGAGKVVSNGRGVGALAPRNGGSAGARNV